jgi:hypothetical protein
MKTRIIFLVLLMVCISCGTNNKPLSDAQKVTIKGQVKEVVDTFFKGCEEVNMDMVLGTCFNSPEFAYINNGYVFSYKECMDIFKPVFASMSNQKITIVDEKFTFPDNSTVFYSNHCKSLTNYKDGHAILQDPTVMLLIFKKIDNSWKIIYGVESYISQNVKNTETSKDLIQIELHKKFDGSWKSEVGKDTTCFWDVKPLGTGRETSFKYVTNGKTISEGKSLWGYDTKLDKFLNAEMIKGMDNEFYASWFTTKNKCLMFAYGDISNPENAKTKWDMEFKSQNLFVMTTTINNKPVKVETWTRIK